jgi:NAD(P)-dependent dehydrogenase (short-subunit alcohol dehydrogenase family)
VKLAEKVAIVTGGAKGIGEAVTRAFLDEGAFVVVVDIDEEAGNALIDELGAGKASFSKTDVSAGNQVEALMAATVKQHGRIDILVNNAGYHISKSVEETTEEEWNYIIDTNLKSTFLCSKFAIPHLRKTRGAIVNMSSMVGLVGQSKAGAYSATKGGQIAMTRGMALDFAADGVRANAICPGWVETPLVVDWFNQQPDPKAAREYIHGVHPLGRISDPVEIARAAVFLASDDAGSVTGVALPVDGAVTLGY